LFRTEERSKHENLKNRGIHSFPSSLLLLLAVSLLWRVLGVDDIIVAAARSPPLVPLPPDPAAAPLAWL